MKTEFRETSPQGVALREAHVEGDVIQNVALLGSVSLNNRVYTEQAMKDAAKLYNGAPVYIDHPTESEMEDRQGVRSVMDLAGRVLRSRIAGEQGRPRTRPARLRGRVRAPGRATSRRSAARRAATP